MSLSLQVLRRSLRLGPSDPRVAAAFPGDEQRILWSASSFGAQSPPNWMRDLGSQLVADIQHRLQTSDIDEIPWLARSSACLFGLLLHARANARWGEPAGTPLFVELHSQATRPVLVSPLRLVLDGMVPSGSSLVATYQSLLGFPQKGVLPAEVFRISPYEIAPSRRMTWQWAWALVAAAGRFRGSNWDLDFSQNSFPRVTQLVYGHGELGMSGVALASVDRESTRKWMWLRHAASAYLAESFYRLFGHYGLRVRAEAGLPGRAILFGPHCVDLGEVCDSIRAGDLDALPRLMAVLSR